MPFSCSTSCCAFFSLLLMLLTNFFQIFLVAAWLIPSEGLVRHLTQSVSKTKDEEQLTLHTYSVLLPLYLLMERRWINACWEATTTNSLTFYTEKCHCFHDFLVIKLGLLVKVHNALCKCDGLVLNPSQKCYCMSSTWIASLSFTLFLPWNVLQSKRKLKK